MNAARIIISATGQPGLLTPDMFDGTDPKIMFDVGTAVKDGRIVGDISDELRAFGRQHGWSMTPKARGVGPLTVLNLLSNAVTAAEAAEPVEARGTDEAYRLHLQSHPQPFHLNRDILYQS